MPLLEVTAFVVIFNKNMPTPIGERGVLNTKAFSDARVFFSRPALIVYMAVAAAYIAWQASEGVGGTLESKSYTATLGDKTKIFEISDSESDSGDPDQEEKPCENCRVSGYVWTEENGYRQRVPCPVCKGSGWVPVGE